MLAALVISSCQKSAKAERPLPTDLLTDEPLAVDVQTIPGREAEAFSDWIRENNQPIRSLTDEHYDDLDFLEPLLQGKRIVQLMVPRNQYDAVIFLDQVNIPKYFTRAEH